MAHYLFNFSKKGAAKGTSLREQAGELVQTKMWGIGAKAPNRVSLASGDQVLIYVGAPEFEFIGHAELGSGAHEWTPEEAARYPGDFESGVVFREGQLWPHPLAMKTVLSSLELAQTNPGARFFSGVIRITQRDYEDVVAAGSGHEPETREVRAISPPTSPASFVDVDLLFRTAEKIREVAGVSGTLSEYDTRAEFIDRYLEALGYTELGDIQRGSPVDSGSFPDYVLRVNGQPRIAIEAKKLGAPLGAKDAAQVVAYCSNLGVRWGAVTDGRYFRLYDAPVLGVPPEERVVLAIDLSDYRDREDFEARIYPALELIAKTELESGAGLERRVALQAIRELLTSSGSKTLRALRQDLETRNIGLTPDELSESPRSCSGRAAPTVRAPTGAPTPRTLPSSPVYGFGLAKPNPV